MLLTWPRAHKKIMLNSTKHKISTSHKLKCWKTQILDALKLKDVFIPLINVKMPTIVGILTFLSILSRIYYMLRC